MRIIHRPAASRISLGCLTAAALALGTVSATALSAGSAGATSGKVTVSVATIGNDKVLIASGKPLYFLKPSAVTCGSSCLKIWPALTLPAGVHKATAGKGVQAAKLGSKSGPNGLRQVTYAGHRVYWFALDNVPGTVKGNFTDKWGKWTAVVVSKGSSTTTTSSGSNGGANSGSGGVSF
jgi:predicted lipoprotein with Yx(FWY)xxD motif